MTDEDGFPANISLDRLGPERAQMLSDDKFGTSSFMISVIRIPELDSRPFEALTMIVDSGMYGDTVLIFCLKVCDGTAIKSKSVLGITFLMSDDTFSVSGRTVPGINRLFSRSLLSFSDSFLVLARRETSLPAMELIMARVVPHVVEPKIVI